MQTWTDGGIETSIKVNAFPNTDGLRFEQQHKNIIIGSTKGKVVLNGLLKKKLLLLLKKLV